MWIKRRTARKPIRIGPVRINTSDLRWTSTSVVLGRVSWNSRSPFKVTINTPGPGGFELGTGKKR